MTRVEVKRKHREAACCALHRAPGVMAGMTISESDWVRLGGIAPSYYDLEPQQRFLEVTAQAIADAEQRGYARGLAEVGECEPEEIRDERSDDDVYEGTE